MKAKIKTLKICQLLIGQYVPPSKDGHAGRYAEHMLESAGFTMNRGHGPDILPFGLEVKTRDLDATSPQTIADMSLDEIVSTPYNKSHVHDKFQQQLRVYIKDRVIISADIYDFSLPRIQRVVEDAYEHARKQLIENPWLEATSCKGKYHGYFEKCAGKQSYSFRLSTTHMTDLENMATSNFDNIFEF